MTCSKVVAVEKKKGEDKHVIQFHWSEVHHAAFEKLVYKCCEATVLAYADYSKPTCCILMVFIRSRSVKDE